MIKRIINSRIVFRVIYRFMTSLKPKRLIGVGLILSLSLTNGLALSLLSTKTAYAAPNYQINYQGKLADSSGTAVADGSYSIVFNLYTASSGGTAIWTESHTGANKVSVTSGLFSTMLGSITSLSTVDFNQTLYLGVTVESDSEMTPRKILGAVPAAFQADKLDGLDSTDFISTSTSALTKVWSSTGLGQIGSTTATTTFLGNLAAVGTTVLNGILSVYQNVTAPYFTATSTSVASTFPYASTTAISATTASSTNLIASTAATFSFLGSGLTKVTNGALGLATAGTDYLTSAFQSWQLSGGYLTPTTTQVVKVDGLISTASSTFNGDLNIVGNATATNATTTNLAVTSQASTSQLTVSKSATFTFLGSGLTKLTSGVLSLATAGTDYLTSAFQSWQLSGGYLTPTTTQTVLLNNGFISTASSTVSGLLTVNYASTTAVSSTATSTFGAVGVGTSLPSSLLSINNGASYQRTKGLQITDGSKSGYFYQFSSAGTYSLQSGGDLIFEVNGANEAARLVGTNKFLGVGTSSPYARLSVVGQTVSEYFTATSTTQASTFPYASTTALSATSICLTGDTCRTTWPTGGSSFGQAWEIVSGYLTPTTTQTVLLNNGFVSTASSTVSGLLTTTYSSTTALTVSGTGSALIVSSGNVGIGTTSPSRNFVLSGTNPFLRVNNDSTGNSVFELSINGTSKSFLGTAGSSNGLVTGSSAGDTVLRTQGQNLLFTTDSGTTAHMVINTSGYVGIGTASPTAKLHVAGNIYSSGTISGSSLVGNTFNAVAANNTGFSAGNTEAAGALNAYMFRQNIGGDTTYGMNYATVLSNDAYYNGTNWIRRNQYTQPVILTLGGDGANTGIFRVMYGGFGAGSDERFTPTELFRVNSSGYMGIGTSTPNSHLSIYDSGNTAAGQRIELGYNSSFNYIFGRNPTTGLMDFTGTNTGGSQYIGYTFNGKVGVGSTSPQAKLAISAGNILLDNNQWLQAYKNG